MRIHLAATIVGLALGASITGGVAVMSSAATTDPGPGWGAVHHPWTPPARARWMHVICNYEDSLNCTWNASAQGNHRGHSFYTVRRPLVDVHGQRIGRVVCVYYARFADHHWDACHVLPAGESGRFN